MKRPKDFLEKFRERGEGLPEDIHITRVCSSLIAISEGEILDLTEPVMNYCPLADRFGLFKDTTGSNTENLKKKIALYMQDKIEEFGLFTRKRNLSQGNVTVPYGASEIMMYDLSRGEAEAAIVACDGAGSILTENPRLVQGIGARMNGIFYTTPIREVIEGIEERDGLVLFPETARIDQVEALKKAQELDYENIDITISGFGRGKLKEIRETEEENGVDVTLLSICNTGVEEKEVEDISQHADLVWSCASKKVRTRVGKNAKIQVATKIPIFCLTKKGLNFLGSYSTGKFGDYVRRNEEPYLVSGRCKGIKGVRNPQKIRMNGFETFIGATADLPIRTENEPDFPQP